MNGGARIVVLRGHHHNVAELRSWELLTDRYDVVVGETGSNRKDVSTLGLERIRMRARRDRLPGGRLGDLATIAAGDRYLDLRRALGGADIVHTAELGVWFSGQPARLKAELGFKLVVTVWETIPFRETFRAFRGRADRRATIAATDIFVAARSQIVMVFANGVALVLVLALGFALVPPYGALGAAWAALLAEAALALCLWLGLRRVRPNVVPDLRSAWKVLLTLGLSVAVVLLLDLATVLEALVAVVVFGVGTVVLRAVPPEIAQALRFRA
jgi:hypothetical protein